MPYVGVKEHALRWCEQHPVGVTLVAQKFLLWIDEKSKESMLRQTCQFNEGA
jgi:hypothetical protein